MARLIAVGILFGLLFGGTMTTLILITDGPAGLLVFLVTPITIASAIALPLFLKDFLEEETDAQAAEISFRRAWRQLSPALVVSIVGVVGVFVFGGWISAVCSLIALVGIIFIAWRLRQVT